MKILVTGHEGFIGSHLVTRLTELGHNVDGWEWDPDANNWPNLSGYDWCIHEGAISSTTERDLEKIFRQNLDFSEWLLDECLVYGVNLQYASSASVYGAQALFKEDGPMLPVAPYSWTKWMMDRTAAKVIAKDRGIVIQGFRYFNVYGGNEHHKGDMASVFHKFPKQAKEEKRITIFEGSESFLRDFVCVDDVVETHVQMMDNDVSGVFNVGTGEARSFEFIAKKIAKKIGVPIEYIPMPDKIAHHYQRYTCAHMLKTNSFVKINWKMPEEWIEENVKA